MDKKGKIALTAALILAGVLLLSLAIAKPGARGAKACNDGQDNDGDSYIDYPNDPGCVNKNDNSELNPAIECDDGVDNDGDDDIDYNDGGCSEPTDDDETNCGDGVCEGGENHASCPADCPNYCNDSDGGFVIDVAGVVSGESGGVPYSYADYCHNSTSVWEYSCVGDQPSAGYPADCTYKYTSCYEGACI